MRIYNLNFSLYFTLLISLFLQQCSTDKQTHSLKDKNISNSSSSFFLEEPSFKEHPLIRDLANMKTDTLDCSAHEFWKIVAKGKSMIPYLIENITDTTPTQIYNCCKQQVLNIGEVCHFALQNIASFPAYSVTKIQFDVIYNNDECPCWSFYGYLFDNRNKEEYKNMLKEFYESNQYEYVPFGHNDIDTCLINYGYVGYWKIKYN